MVQPPTQSTRSVLDADSVIRSMAALVGSGQVGATLSVPDQSGRLRVVASRGIDIRVASRSRSSNRRRVLRPGSR